jgi:hypothetical protein
MSNIVKFQSLELNQKYQVKQIGESFKTQFGECLILLVTKNKSDEAFELYATKLLIQYITEKKPTKKFTFIVKGNNDRKYPFIEGYNQERSWTVLE